MRAATKAWIEADRRHAWHPFTDQKEWEKQDPLIITRGEGVWLYDSEGRKFLDANSSIWTNIHGHSHPKIVEAIQEQASTLCHSSYLGFGNNRASELAERLCHLASLDRCFFSDDGSTALEVALKMSLQWHQNQSVERTGIIAFERAYHGDTLGASSVGGVSRFVKGYGESGLQVYRVTGIDDLLALPEVVVKTASAVVIEPLIQGVNQMRLWPAGMLKQLRDWCSKNEIHLILDEVMTGFGRTGKMFACQHENVRPDFLCLAKGLTGGTMPLAATLTTDEIYQGFSGPERTFYYGHSYTGNALGCAAALASLEIFESEGTLDRVEEQGAYLESLMDAPGLRRLGLILAFESDDITSLSCQMRKRGVLSRAILDTMVIMPPLSISNSESELLAASLR